MRGEARFDESQTAINVRRGDTFSVNLAGSPGATGIGWELVGSPKQLEFLGKSFEPDSDRWGAGGMERFGFRANTAGVETVNFELTCPFMPLPPAERKKHQVTVTIDA